jgi:hypothetical protein
MTDQVSVVDQPVTLVVDQSITRVQVVAPGTTVSVAAPETAVPLLDTPAGQIQVFSAIGGAGGLPQSEVPSGAVDGVNAEFVLSSIPVAGSLVLTVNGLVQVVGYSRLGQTVTFDAEAIPRAGDHVFAIYSR